MLFRDTREITQKKFLPKFYAEAHILADPFKHGHVGRTDQWEPSPPTNGDPLLHAWVANNFSQFIIALYKQNVNTYQVRVDETHTSRQRQIIWETLNIFMQKI